MNNDTKYRNKTINEINVDINKIREQALNLVNDSEIDLTVLSTKYNYLYINLLSLFTKIYKDKDDEKNKKERFNKNGVKEVFIFNKLDFENSLDIILSQYSKIKNKSLNNDDTKTHEDLRKQFDLKYLDSKLFR